MNKTIFFDYDRKIIVSKLYRSLLKSITNLREIDWIVHDFVKLEIFQQFYANKNLTKTKDISFLLKKGFAYLEKISKDKSFLGEVRKLNN